MWFYLKSNPEVALLFCFFVTYSGVCEFLTRPGFVGWTHTKMDQLSCKKYC